MRGKTIVILVVLLVIGVGGGFALGSWYLRQDQATGRGPGVKPPVAGDPIPQQGAETVRVLGVSPSLDGDSASRIEVQLDAAPRDPKAVEAGFSLVPRVAGTFTWQDSTLVFQPADPFQPGHLYTARLEAAGVLPGVDGRLIDGRATQWSFITGDAAPMTITGIRYYGAGYQLTQRQPDGSEQVLAPLPPDKSFVDPVWSPAGDRVLFQSGFLFDLSVDKPDTIVSVAGIESGAPGDYHGVWSPDGRAAAFTQDGKLYTIGLTPGAAMKPLPGTYSGTLSLAWSPAGGSLAVLAQTGASGELWLVPLGGGAPTSVAKGVAGFAWSPDGKALAYVTGSGSSADLHLYSVAGKQSSLAGKVPAGPLFWSPDGARIAVLSGDGLYTFPSSGGPVSPVTRGVRDRVGDVTWSPTGAYLAYVDKQGHLWRVRADGDGPTQLTSGEGQWLSPHWADR